MNRLKNASFLSAVAVAALLAAGDASAQSKVDRGGRNLFSKEQDIELGRETAAQAEKQYPLLNDPEVDRYVADLGARVASHAPGHAFPYSFKVVNIADINAFALPGGPIYINRGTIEQARSEGELVGVIAHEISHVDLRHGTRQATKAYGAQIGLALLGSLIGSGDTTRQVINLVGGFSFNSVLLKYSRTAESDSDILGSQMMAKAGYDPREMATFFELLAAQSPRRTSDFFSSHPAPERRKERIEHEAALLGVGQVSVPQDRFKSIQARLRQMPPAPTMEQLKAGQVPPSQGGSTAGSGLPTSPGRPASPSRSLVWHEHPQRAYRIAHPENWKVVSQSADGATLAPEGGAYRSSRGVEITHGVLVGIVPAKAGANGRVTLDGATDAFVAEVREGSEYLRAISGSRRSVTIDKGAGSVLTLMGAPSAGAERERVDVVTTLVGSDRLAYMLFVTPESAPREYEQLLEAMIRNFRIAGR